LVVAVGGPDPVELILSLDLRDRVDETTRVCASGLSTGVFFMSTVFVEDDGLLLLEAVDGREDFLPA
jgi:hypothetical protein